MNRGRGEPTPLSAISASVPGPAGRLLAARRRWRGLVGPALARTLPLLGCQGRRWLIGLPSPAWEAALIAAARRWADDPGAPELVGRILPDAAAPRPRPEPGGRAPAAPRIAGSPAEKLAELRRRLESRRRRHGTE